MDWFVDTEQKKLKNLDRSARSSAERFSKLGFIVFLSINQVEEVFCFSVVLGSVMGLNVNLFCLKLYTNI